MIIKLEREYFMVPDENGVHKPQLSGLSTLTAKNDVHAYFDRYEDFDLTARGNNARMDRLATLLMDWYREDLPEGADGG